MPKVEPTMAAVQTLWMRRDLMVESVGMPHPPEPAISRRAARRMSPAVRARRMKSDRLFTGSELHALGHGALHVALVFSVGDGVAFVVLGFAFADAEGDFGVSP